VRALHIIATCTAALAVLLLALPLLWRVATGDYYMTVTGESMRPTYDVGDVLVVQEPTGTELTTIGQIVVVTFTPGDRSSQYVHRVESVTPEGTRLKGDGNDTPDPVLVDRSQLEGTPRHVFTGTSAAVFTTLQQPLVRFAFGAIVVGWIFLNSRLSTVRRRAPRAARQVTA
jgi:signal peptidase I